MSENQAENASPENFLPYRGSFPNVPAGWTHVSAHGIRPELAHLQWWRTLRILILIWVPLVCGVLVFIVWEFRDDPHARTLALIIAPLFMLALMILRLFRMRAQYKRRVPTFRIIVADQGIMRTSIDLPDLPIRAEDIQWAREFSAGLYVRGRRKVDVAVIPRGIEEYAAVRARVAAMRPITRGSYGFFMTSIVVYLVLLAGYFVGIATTNHALRRSLIVVLLCLALWTLVRSLTSPNTTLRQKIAAPVVLIFPLGLLMAETLPAIWRTLFA